MDSDATDEDIQKMLEYKTPKLLEFECPMRCCPRVKFPCRVRTVGTEEEPGVLSDLGIRSLLEDARPEDSMLVAIPGLAQGASSPKAGVEDVVVQECCNSMGNTLMGLVTAEIWVENHPGERTEELASKVKEVKNTLRTLQLVNMLQDVVESAPMTPVAADPVAQSNIDSTIEKTKEFYGRHIPVTFN